MIPRLTLGQGATVIGALLVILFAGLWLRGRDARIRAEGEVKVLRVELDTAKARAAREVAAADSVAAVAARERAASDARAALAEQRIERERRERAAAERRLADAIRTAPAKTDTIVLAAAAGDTSLVRERVTELIETERAEWQGVVRSDSVTIRELLAVNASQLMALEAADARDVARVRAIDAVTERAEAAERALEAALRTSPGWFERTGWKLAIPAAVALGWIACDQLCPEDPPR